MNKLYKILTNTTYHSSKLYSIDCTVEEFRKRDWGSAHGSTTILKDEILDYIGTKYLHPSVPCNPYSCWVIEDSPIKERIGMIFQIETYNQNLINYISAQDELKVVKLNGCRVTDKSIINYYLELLANNDKITLPYLKEYSDGRNGAGSYGVCRSLTNNIRSTNILYVRMDYYNNMMFYTIARDKDFEYIIAAKYVKECEKDSTFNITTGTYFMDSSNIKDTLDSFLKDKNAIKTYGIYNCHFKINLNKYNDKKDKDGFYYYKPTKEAIENSNSDLVSYIKTKELFSGSWQQLIGIEGEIINLSRKEIIDTSKYYCYNGIHRSRNRYENITKQEYENFKNNE
jgi:hypothetical protein